MVNIGVCKQKNGKKGTIFTILCYELIYFKPNFKFLVQTGCYLVEEYILYPVAQLILNCQTPDENT